MAAVVWRQYSEIHSLPAAVLYIRHAVTPTSRNTCRYDPDSRRTPVRTSVAKQIARVREHVTPTGGGLMRTSLSHDDPVGTDVHAARANSCSQWFVALCCSAQPITKVTSPRSGNVLLFFSSSRTIAPLAMHGGKKSRSLCFPFVPSQSLDLAFPWLLSSTRQAG